MVWIQYTVDDSIEQPAFFRLSDVNHKLQIERMEHQAVFSPDYQFDGILGLYSLSNGSTSPAFFTHSTLSGDHHGECCDWQWRIWKSSLQGNSPSCWLALRCLMLSLSNCLPRVTNTRTWNTSPCSRTFFLSLICIIHIMKIWRSACRVRFCYLPDSRHSVWAAERWGSCFPVINGSHVHVQLADHCSFRSF